MPGAVTVSVTLDKDYPALLASLRSLPDKMQMKILRRASRWAANQFKREIISRAPTLTGKLRQSIRVKSLKARRGVVSFEAVTNVQTAKQKKEGKGGDVFYGGFVEFGTQTGGGRAPRVRIRGRRVGGGRIGGKVRMKPHPFVRPAYAAIAESTAGSMMQMIGDDIEKAFQEAAAEASATK